MMVVSIAALLMGMGSANAAVPVQWLAEDGGNGHYYEFVDHVGITWSGAEAAAAAMSFEGTTGHLATVTSQAENDFIAANLSWGDSAWMGGWQEEGMAPTEGWHWITGEPWVFANWGTYEPNDYDIDERYVSMWGSWATRLRSVGDGTMTPKTPDLGGRTGTSWNTPCRFPRWRSCWTSSPVATTTR
jgi:hypothetical protein